MPNPQPPLAISAYTSTSAAGCGLNALTQALQTRRGGLISNDFSSAPLTCWIGRVPGLEAMRVPDTLRDWDCRNNRLAWLGLQQDGFLDAVQTAVSRYGANRVALILGTSTGSIGATEEAYRDLDADGQFAAKYTPPMLHTPHSLVAFVQQALGTRGPACTVATACSSSAKVFAQAERLIRHGFADAAVVGGVDTLCDSVLFGFGALQLVSAQPCRPFDTARDGISIGEAASFALLQRAEDAPDAAQLIGWGESSDAHHMSAPHPEGLGAQITMTDAMQRASITPEQVDYINLHGTATPKNDEVEAGVISRMFPARLRASSSKGWTGHTLGAAGATEAVISLIALREQMIPGTLNCTDPDPQCAAQLVTDNETGAVQIALSNSFGFGGNNCTLAFRRGARG